MELFANKSWMAQELYNEYLNLKIDIQSLVQKLDYLRNTGRNNVPGGTYYQQETELNTKVKRFKTILNELRMMHGILLEDLILLSLGVDIEPTK